MIKKCVWLGLVFVILLTACTKNTNNIGIYALVVGAGRGKLLFGHRVVYAVDERGSVLNLDILERLGWDTEWSPDGQWIVHRNINLGDNFVDIYLMHADNNDQTVRLTYSAGSYAPTWSPDGSQIAFYAYDEKSRDNAIYLLNVECVLRGENCTPKPTFLIPGDDPDWSPDGRKMVYRDASKNEIYVVDIYNPTEKFKVSQGLSLCHSPQWSPDGTKIGFVCNYTMYSVDSNGENLVNFGIQGLYLKWSPDGKKMAFIGTEALDPNLGQVLDVEGMITSTAVFIMDTDGTNITRITKRNDESIGWFTWIPTNSMETK